ncbi:sialate O-acetylesterase [Spirosoma panaciterrae]|uniref:sialate O-acetylesterase n=1 Tax=Spirosoma panaciterrae TaxID=496058 RepID=UPI0004781628|nr:sialate O-acetylesterase [Spirosoma panaciterrae]
MKWLPGLLLLIYCKTATAQKQHLFLIAGQSNAVGQGTATQSVICSPGVAWAYRVSTDSLVALADPFGERVGHFEPAATGSIAPAFAQEFYRITGERTVLLSTARGGSSCHQRAELGNYGTWAETGHLPLLNESVANTKRAMLKTGLPLRGIIWIQGERDANAIADTLMTGNDYAKALTQVIHRYRQAFGTDVPFYIVQTGYQAGRTPAGSKAVRAAQRAVSRRLPKTYVVYRKTNEFAQRGWMKDFVHYNQTGLNDIGQKTARFVRKQLN